VSEVSSAVGNYKIQIKLRVDGLEDLNRFIEGRITSSNVVTSYYPPTTLKT
jgi:hypothetical protein